MVVVLLLAVVGAAHGGGGDATLSGEVALGGGGGGAVDGNVALESTRGRSGVLGTWRGDVGGKGVRGDKETNFMPTTRGIGRISNNFDATLK